ncbi:MAG: transporter permease, partial [Devosia sp.]|nr:transporter permease [Devosia sp.]
IATLAAGAGRTVQYSISSMIVGLVIGILCAVGRNSRVAALRILCAAYVEFVRNTPLLVQILIIYFGLPAAGVRLDANTAAIIALIFNFGAYATEIVRSGIEAVPPGQIEAAEALGLNRFEIFRHVVILPALEKVYPALVSQFTLLMLGSAVVSAIGAHELTSSANAIGSRTFRSFEIYLITTAAYLGLALAFRGGLSLIARLIFPRRRALGARAVGAHS